MEKTNKKALITKIALIIGVLIIPLMYSYFYLKAFWDPYARLDKVPIAMVDLDVGATINGEERNLGKEICDELTQDGTLDLRFATPEEAEKGVKGNKYYASITIPMDFSARAATVGKDTEKLHGKIIFRTNQKRNYLASQILENAIPRLKEKANAGIDRQIVSSLAENLRGVPDKLVLLYDGLGQLSDGAGQINDGAGQLATGTGTLSAGIDTLNSKVPTLSKGATKLNSGASALKKGLNTLSSNSGALNNGAGELSKGAGDLKNGLSAYTDGVSQAKEGADLLDLGLIAARDGVDLMVKKVTKAKEDLDTEASDEMLDALSEGAQGVSDGADALDTAYSTFVNEQAPQLIAAYKQTGDEQYLNQLMGALGQFKTNIGDLSEGATQVNNGVAGLTQGMKDVKSNIKELLAGLQLLDGSFDELILPGSDKLTKGLAKLTSNNKALNDGASALSTGAGSLKKGVSSYTGGVDQAATGSNQLASGTSKIKSSLPALTNGVAKLDAGGRKLADGAGTLADGTGKLKEGIDTAADGVDDSIVTANNDLGVLDGIEGYAEEPVKTKSEYIEPVANYGSAFGPYFMGLSLWVGGLLIFFGIYFDYYRRIKSLSKESTRYALRTLFFALVSVGQGLLLAFVVKSVLHIHVNNPTLLYGSCILTALTFTAIIQFCIVDLGDIGKFLAMLLLILQLTSCGGTFPIETQNAFFRALNPFMPMTYSTQLFKEAISGTAGKAAAYNAGILALFMVVFIFLTLAFSNRKIGKAIREKKAREAAAKEAAAAAQ